MSKQFTISFKDWCIKNKNLELLKYFYLGKNGIDPSKIGFSSTICVNFKCDKCNNTWSRSLNKATRKIKENVCPFCAKRFTSQNYNLEYISLELASEWDIEKNNNKPSQVFPYSRKKVFWKCNKGHTFEATPADRMRFIKKKSKDEPNCFYCGKRKVSDTYNLVTEFPEISKELNYSKNGNLNPFVISPCSAKTVWWKCSFNPAHEWKDRVSNRTVLHRGCPKCSKEFSVSYPSRVLFYYLSLVIPDCHLEYQFMKQYKIDICLLERKIAIEHDGYYYHGNKDSIVRDTKKEKLLKEQGFRVIRIQDSKDIEITLDEKKDLIIYKQDERHKYLDEMIKVLFRYLSLEKIEINHEKDRIAIDNLYYHERKRHTLAVSNPKLLKEWSKKNKYTPDTVYSKSNYNAIWNCSKCKQEYKARVINRVNLNSGCPYCSNKKVYKENSLATLFPEIAKEWHPTLNDGLTPNDVTKGCDLKVWWKCSEGHEWSTRVYNRTGKAKSRCPYCSRENRKKRKINV